MRHFLRLHLLLLLVSAGSLHAQTQPRVEGTLFTSAEERRYLDYLREDFLLRNQQNGFNIEDTQIPEIPTDGIAGPTGPNEYTLDGILRRGDGRISVWLNNQLVTEDGLPANARLVRDGASYAIQFTTATGPQLLRPGQTLQLATGTVQERYQRPALMPADAGAETATTDNGTATGADADADAGSDTGATMVPAEPAPAATESAPAAAEPTANIVAAPVTPAVIDTTDADQVVESLPADVRTNPALLDSMIESLQALRQQAGTDDDDSE